MVVLSSDSAAAEPAQGSLLQHSSSSTTPSSSMAAASARSLPELPNECLHGIFAWLPPNCIPLAVRQLSKELRLYYVDHTTVYTRGKDYLPTWGVLAALPQLKSYDHPFAMAALARHGDLEGMQQLLQQLGYTNGLPWTPDCNDALLSEAAAIGQLDIVRWLVEEQGCASLANCSRATASAARGGHEHVLEWLRELEPPFKWARGTCVAAAAGGQIQTLEWLRSKGKLAWDARACTAAASNGQLETLKHLHANDCPWSSMAVHMAALHKHHAVVQWLRDHVPGTPSPVVSWSDDGIGDEEDGKIRAELLAQLGPKAPPAKPAYPSLW